MVQILIMLEFNVDNKRVNKPNWLHQTMCRTHLPKGRQVMRVEYNSLQENETWELTLKPENRQVITDWYCFKLKKDRNEKTLKYKARWLAHKFQQQEEVDFVEIFAAVEKFMSYKCLFGVKCKLRLQNPADRCSDTFLVEISSQNHIHWTASSWWTILKACLLSTQGLIWVEISTTSLI